MREVKLKRVYKHFKGDYYLVEDLAKYSETGEDVVVYRKLYDDGELWVRPLSMFLEEVDREKYPDCPQKYRYELQEIESVKKSKTRFKKVLYYNIKYANIKKYLFNCYILVL